MPLQLERSWPWWQPWLALGLFAFLLHFAWEILQAPFYAGMASARHWAAVLVCVRATGGDVVIAWTAYALAAVDARDPRWLRVPDLRRPLAVYLATGLLITIGLEWSNVYVRRQWAYSSHMPVILGIGLMPLLQWLLVPLFALWLVRRHLGLPIGSARR